MNKKMTVEVLDTLPSEARNPTSHNLDRWTALEIISAMNQEDKGVPIAVEAVLPAIAQLIEHVVLAFQQGGRLIYLGAGTSGRLGVLDASECPPTFGVPPSQIVGIIAGGDNALRSAIEAVEDDENAAKIDLQTHGLTSKDIVVGIAASGRTPYVIGGLNYAKELKCYTAAITSDPHSRLAQLANLAISPVVGPEVLTGSTRLKSGTAQKLILNMITTASLVLLGKVYQNLMVDVKATNMKLKHRAIKIVMEATLCDVTQAKHILSEADFDVKLAILMQLTDLPKRRAQQLLTEHHGYLANTLQQSKDL